MVHNLWPKIVHCRIIAMFLQFQRRDWGLKSSVNKYCSWLPNFPWVYYGQYKTAQHTHDNVCVSEERPFKDDGTQERERLQACLHYALWMQATVGRMDTPEGSLNNSQNTQTTVGRIDTHKAPLNNSQNTRKSRDFRTYCVILAIIPLTFYEIYQSRMFNDNYSLLFIST